MKAKLEELQQKLILHDQQAAEWTRAQSLATSPTKVQSIYQTATTSTKVQSIYQTAPMADDFASNVEFFVSKYIVPLLVLPCAA